MIRQQFQILDHQIVIEVDSDMLASRLSFLGQSAAQEVAISRTITYRVATVGHEFHVFEDDRLVDIELDTATVLERVHERLHRRIFAAITHRGWVRLHSGLARWDTRRFLLAGSKGSGKTTLLARLAVEGAAIEGDESVVIDGQKVAAFPRSLRIKEGTIRLVPSLRGLVADASSVIDEWGTPVFAWEPSTNGAAWRTRFAPVTDVVYIEPNHGGRSRIVPMPRYLMAQRLMPEVLVEDPVDRSWLGPVCATLAVADTYELRLGDLDLAIEQLRSKLVPGGGPP